MRLKPGCGCVLIILALINVVLFVSTIIAVTKETITPLGGVGMGALFVADALACGLLGFYAFRRRLGTEGGPAGEADYSTGVGQTGAEAEGTDDEDTGNE